MAVIDPYTFELLSGPPLPAAFPGCGNQPTAEFNDAYLRAIGALPPLPPVHFAPTPVHQAAVLHDSVELPATCELYAAALDAHVPHPAVEVHFAPTPVHQDAVLHDSVELPATCELYAAALDAHVLHPAVDVHFAPTPVDHATELHDCIELPATCELYAAALDVHVLYPAVEAPVADSKNSMTSPLLSDYDADIDVNLREIEKNAKQRPSAEYLKMLQGDPKSQYTRAKLVFWMENLTAYFDLAPGTLHRAVSYVDRFLSERILSPTHMEQHELHLLGATAVYAAAKYEEMCTRLKVNAAGIAWYCGFPTTKEEVIDMELDMLATLRYELSGPTAYTFVEHFTRHSKGGEQDLEVQRLAQHFAETSMRDYRWLQHPPSAMAASAVFLARLILNPTANQVKQWNKDFEELTGYKHTDLILGIHMLYIMNPDPRLYRDLASVLPGWIGIEMKDLVLDLEALES